MLRLLLDLVFVVGICRLCLPFCLVFVVGICMLPLDLVFVVFYVLMSEKIDKKT